jgi:hypothetical protein
MSGTDIPMEIGGLTLTPGVYTHYSPIYILSSSKPWVILDAQGNEDAVFIFVARSKLSTANESKIVLVNGAKAENVFWIIGTLANIGSHSTFAGNMLAGTAITIGLGGMIVGRVIAGTAVTCSSCTIITDRDLLE